MSSKRVTGQDAAPAIACEPGGDQAGTQEQRWMRLGRDAGLGRDETTGGPRVRFRDEPGAEQELRAVAAVEGSRCAWARWQVHRPGSELVLQVTSTPETAATLHAMFSTGTAPAATAE